MSLLLVTIRKIYIFLNYHSRWLFSLQQIQKCVFFGHSLSAIDSHSHATIKHNIKDEPSIHLRKWWKILLLFNLDLLASSLPRDRPPSLCRNTLILLIFTTFSPVVPTLRTQQERESEESSALKFHASQFMCLWTLYSMWYRAAHS